MNLFLNFFFKTIAFFLAISLFVFLIILGLGFIESKNAYKDNLFIFQEGDIESNNIIVTYEINGPIFHKPSGLEEFQFLSKTFDAIYVDKIESDFDKIDINKTKGIIISINSPGGSVSASYRLYEFFANYKKENGLPIYIHTNELLASGGYWAALSADKIYSSYGALIGSIGVRGPEWIYFNNPISISTGLIGQSIETKDGIENYSTIAGKSKDLLNPFRMPTEKEIKSLQKIVDGIYLDFVNAVAKNRSIENQFITNNLGAMLFDAKQAKQNYLIDTIISYKDVKKLMINKLKLKDYKILKNEEKNKNFFEKIVQSFFIIEYNIDSLQKNNLCKLVNSNINVLYTDFSSSKDC